MGRLAPRKNIKRQNAGMPSSVHADLHCHSTISDGTLTPEDVARRAHANGVTLWALTDHDEVAGQPRAARAAAALGMDYLTGVEISVTFADTTVHIVGLGFDADNAALVQGLAATRDGRDARGREMAAQLDAVGIHGAYEGAMRYAGNPALLARPHFARYIVEQGLCADVSEVFRKYLTEGKPGYVPHRWARLGDAVRWITEAGGLAVIAHPARYRFSPTEEYALFPSSRRMAGAAWRWSPAATPAPNTPPTPTWRASSICSPPPAATFTAPTNRTPTWDRCRPCRRG